MACQHRIFSRLTFASFFKRASLQPLSIKTSIDTSTSSSSQSRLIQQESRRYQSQNPSLRNSPRLASAIEQIKRTTHHSAVEPTSSTEELVKYKRKDQKMSYQTTDPDSYGVIFQNNSQWRRNLSDSHPEIFEKLGKDQQPQILWIGCADSRCPETTILGLQPGDIFCHRNIANVLVPTDINSLSVIQFAVQYLKVKHIIVCGHTSCGGVKAALANDKLGLIDTWLMPIRQLRQQNIKLLESLSPEERALKLVDLNVRRSVDVLLENPVVIDAMLDPKCNLKVHGMIYSVGTGELNELDISESEEIIEARKKAFKIASASH